MLPFRSGGNCAFEVTAYVDPKQSAGTQPHAARCWQPPPHFVKRTWGGPADPAWEGPAEPAYVKRDDGSFLISGWMPALEFADLLGIELPASRPYQTFAGLLLQEFGTIPGVGNKISVAGRQFEIVDLDGRRIDKVLATRLEGA